MRTALALPLMCGVILGACQPSPRSMSEAERATVEEEVRQSLADLVLAMNAHDPEQIFGYFRQTEEFLYLGCTSFLLGWDAYSTRVGSYYKAHPAITFEQEVVEVQVLSPTAAVAAIRGSSTEADALFLTEVLVKEDGAWKITHEHESWPGCPPPSMPHPFTSGSELLDTLDAGSP